MQWQISTDGGKTFANISGAGGDTLMVSNVTTAMNGYEYEAVFTNAIGSTTTSAAALTVNAVSPSPAAPPSTPISTAPPPQVLHVPSLLALFDSLLGGAVAVNTNGTATITDSLFGIPLVVSTFNSAGNLVNVTLFGFNITFLFA